MTSYGDIAHRAGLGVGERGDGGDFESFEGDGMFVGEDWGDQRRLGGDGGDEGVAAEGAEDVGWRMPHEGREGAAVEVQRAWKGFRGKKEASRRKLEQRRWKEREELARERRLEALRVSYEQECAMEEERRRRKKFGAKGRGRGRESGWVGEAGEAVFAKDSFGRRMRAMLQFQEQSRTRRGERGVIALQRKWRSWQEQERERIRQEEERRVLERVTKEQVEVARRLQAIWRGKKMRDRMNHVRKQAWRAKLRVPSADRLRQLFHRIDASGDGTVSGSEWLRVTLKGFTPPDGSDPWAWYQGTEGGGGEGGRFFSTPSPSPSPPPSSSSSSSSSSPPHLTSSSSPSSSPLPSPSSSRRAKLTLSADKHMQVFRAIDADESGEIDEDEFVSFFLNTRDGRMLDWMQELLVYVLEPEEWATPADLARKMHMKGAVESAQALKRRERGLRARKAREVFRGADGSGSGSLTPLAFMRILAKGTPDHPLTKDREKGVKLFQLIDADGSGTIEEEEFVELMRDGGPPLLRSWFTATYGTK